VNAGGGAFLGRVGFRSLTFGTRREATMTVDASTILIVGGQVYDHAGDTDRPEVADVLIVGDRIAAVERGLAARLAGADGRLSVNGRPIDTVVDAADRLVVPGFTNAHYHSHDVLLKGCFETIPRETWLLNALPPNYPRRSRAEIRARTLLGAVECLRSGITTVQDMLTLAPVDPDDVATVLDAYDEVGIRCVFALQTGDVHGARVTPFWEEVFPKDAIPGLSGVVSAEADAEAIVAQLESILQQYKGRHRAITWGLGPSSPERSSPVFLERLGALAARAGVPIFTHVYESRATTLIARQKFARWNGSLIAYLRAHGVLGPSVTLAHGVWMRPDEVKMIAEAGANVVLNPVGNLKTRSGVAPIRDYLEAGVNVGLGCDNCSCSDAQNMFQVMKAFASLPAVSNVDPGMPTAAQAVKAATLGGAQAVGLAGEVGEIKVGAKADLVLLDLTDPSFVPLNSAARQLVFTESGRSVETVIVDGRVVVDRGRLVTVDMAALRRDVEDAMAALREDIAGVVRKTEALAPYLAEAHRRTWAEPLEVYRYVPQGTGKW